jgi:hypothetical protein
MQGEHSCADERREIGWSTFPKLIAATSSEDCVSKENSAASFTYQHNIDQSRDLSNKSYCTLPKLHRLPRRQESQATVVVYSHKRWLPEHDTMLVMSRTQLYRLNFAKWHFQGCRSNLWRQSVECMSYKRWWHSMRRCSLERDPKLTRCHLKKSGIDSRRRE